MRQAMSLGQIVDISCGTNNGVNQAGFCIHANVRLHAKVLLVVLFGVVRFGVTLTRAIFTGPRGGNQSSINHHARLKHRALGRQCRFDGGQQLGDQMMFFEQVTKSRFGGLIEQSHDDGIEPCRLAMQRYVVEGFLYGWVRQTRPLLHKVNAQHGLYGKRGAPTFRPRTSRCTWLDQADQLRPGNDRAHPIQEHPLARALGNQFKSRGGKADLFHQDKTSFSRSAWQGLAEIPKALLDRYRSP